MTEIKIQQRVSVLSGSYNNAKTRIFQVRWGQTEYRVAKQSAHWCSKQGAETIDYFTLKTGAGDVLWLQHYRLKSEWWLERITLC